MKWLVATVVVFGLVLVAPPVDAVPPDTTPPADVGSPGTVPFEGGTPDSVPTVTVSAESGGGSLVIVPAGCEVPPPATVVFVGTLLAKDTRTARFRLEHTRAGSADGFAVGDLVDIRYDDDVRFLAANRRYLVGASPLAGAVVLSSKVRDTKPLFGGNAVIGINDKTVECPVLKDPVRTLDVDGAPISSGVFKTLAGARGDLLVAVLGPVIWAFGIILALVVLRWMFSTMFVLARGSAPGGSAPGGTAPPVRRDRRHHGPPRR
ncbi:unannotated protein [freshwater metagenome]|uniref:Unannotated protein n=1 Tax=freshwater metagenome TaxID=449393 RepID=A0A6J7ED93_9ZZZZ|nr:hypothetical protein [Actinomycetota bacterium]